MKVVTIFLYFFLSISLTATPEQAAANFEHPRGLITMADVNEIRSRLSETPYREILANLQNTISHYEGQKGELAIYDQSYLASMQGVLYLLTG